MGRVKCDLIERLITLTNDNIQRLSLNLNFSVKEWLHVTISLFEKSPLKRQHRINSELLRCLIHSASNI
jgi:hypothetical protein